MNEFIHTFGAVTYLSIAHTRKLEDTYGAKFFYNHKERKYVFSPYADRGFRMEIEFGSSKEKKYTKKHYDYRAEWVVTPAKLLYPGQPMRKLYTREEYEDACCVLHDIIEEIKTMSGVNLLDEAKLYRVDIAKDAETPSDEYSREVIRLAKKALIKYGYNLWSPSEEESEKKEWAEDNSVMFRNHHQEVQSKVYNKLEDMRNNEYDTENLKGLLRFELTLKRKFMKDQGYMCEKYLTLEDLPGILGALLEDAAELMQTHIISPLWSGVMLSKELQKKYIFKICEYSRKSVKYKKMIAYRKECNRKKSMDDVEEHPTVERYFRERGLSPLCTCGDIPYIPSFANILNGTENEEIRAFVVSSVKK